MNCIFICVFNQEKYVQLLCMLLESIFICGNLDENTNIVVYTSTPFMCMVKQTHLYNEKIKFEINDTYTNLDSACKARLDVFKLPVIANYKKILYIDTDVLIRDDINKVFNIIQDDVLYALPEGVLNNNIQDYEDYWGAKKLFGEEVNNYSDKTAFSSGILLFNNCDKMKFLFEKIREDTIIRPHYFNCYDQPYFVYNAFKYNLYNNKVLETVATNNCGGDTTNDKVIQHFPGNPGYADKKLVTMATFLNFLSESMFKCIYDGTLSVKIAKDIANFFVAKTHFNVAETDSRFKTLLAKLFSKVYTAESLEILPNDIECLFIADVQNTKNNLLNAIQQCEKLDYIVFTDLVGYALIDELIHENILRKERIIGENEGMICRINKIKNELINKSYTWENSVITFLDNFQMDAFGRGDYTFIEPYTIQANFGYKVHYITFNEDFTAFSSLRKDDLQNIRGTLCL
jgi:hypothetical protein